LALIVGARLSESAAIPAEDSLTRVVVLVRRSRTKMSPASLVSSAMRSAAWETKATYRPSALIVEL
jgi:hypothetical protein